MKVCPIPKSGFVKGERCRTHRGKHYGAQYVYLMYIENISFLLYVFALCDLVLVPFRFQLIVCFFL